MTPVKNVKKTGFTMIELIMVIIIIGIIAGVTLPKFASFGEKARLASCEATVAAMQIAVQTKYLEKIAQGSAPDNAWPGDCPLGLLTTPLRTTYHPLGWSPHGDDGVTWRYHWEPTYWHMWCPHWDGDGNGLMEGGTLENTKGFGLIYYFGAGGSFTYWRRRARH